MDHRQAVRSKGMMMMLPPLLALPEELRAHDPRVGGAVEGKRAAVQFVIRILDPRHDVAIPQEQACQAGGGMMMMMMMMMPMMMILMMMMMMMMMTMMMMNEGCSQTQCALMMSVMTRRRTTTTTTTMITLRTVGGWMVTRASGIH
jgi:hypothetical protein